MTAEQLASFRHSVAMFRAVSDGKPGSGGSYILALGRLWRAFGCPDEISHGQAYRDWHACNNNRLHLAIRRWSNHA
jgi:hypothetical protein